MPPRSNLLSKFWQELKRRRVIQVVILYSTAAFVIIELVNNVTEPLKLPDWTPTFTIIVLIIGFPLALIFSWIFDVTPEGVEKTKSVDEVEEGVLQPLRVVEKKRIYWGRVINWSITGILMVIVVTYVVIRYFDFSDPAPVLKLSIQLPQGDLLDNNSSGSALAFSADGSNLVYAADREGTSYLFLRRLNEFEAELIPGTEGASAPFFSPDDNWIGFFTNGRLKKVSMLGGAPQVICETGPGLEASWGPNNNIVFSDYNKRCLMMVSANGGTPQQLTTAMRWSNEEIENSHLSPQFLPGSKAILYTVYHNSDNMRISLYSLETGETKTLIEPGSHAVYLKTGHLVYAWKGDLMAVPFDMKKMEVSGQPVEILRGIMMQSNKLAHYSISDNGTLAYVPGKYMVSSNKLVLVDHNGTTEYLDFPPGNYQSPSISPDGKQILISRYQGKANLWIYGLDRGTFRRFTETEYETFWAIWTPDGEKIVFSSNRDGGTHMNLFMKRQDSSGPIDRLTSSNFNQHPKSWSKDGKYLIYFESGQTETGQDVYMIQMEGDRTPVPLHNTKYSETHPIVSPDGNWLAYVSDEPGQDEVFVCSFPEGSKITQISTSGGIEPVWAPDGKELYYRDYSGNNLMAVSITTEPNLQPGNPRIILNGSFKKGYPWGRNYDITPDGKRFLMIEEEDIVSEVDQIHIIYNWFEQLNSKIDGQ